MQNRNMKTVRRSRSRASLRDAYHRRRLLYEVLEDRRLLDGVSFAAPIFSPAGAGPFSVAAADLNGDGRADLVTANWASHDVSVLLGNGDGTFAAQNTFAFGDQLWSVAAADFNGDGRIDLVTGNSYNPAVSVLLGNGDGTFTARSTFAAGENPGPVSTADFNGDGRIDLVAGNVLSGTVSVLLGKGDGTFAAPATFAVGGYPASVAAADVNGDGTTDLVTANTWGDTVSVLLGNGDGTFAAQATFAVGDGPDSVAAADFNGDGHLDLVTANYSSAGVSVLLGNGDGTFAAQATFAVGDGHYSVAAADLTGDGRMDLVTVNAWSGNVSVLLGNGDGTFAAQVIFPAGGESYSVVATDLNGDGRLDLVTANYSSSSISVLLNQHQSPPAPGEIHGTIFVEDFNDDSLSDSWTKTLPSTSGTGVTVVETNQRLEVTLAADAHSDGSGVFDGGVVSEVRVSGDFDIQADYALLEWPNGNNVHVGVFIDDRTGGGSVLHSAQRIGLGSGEAYLAEYYGPYGQYLGVTATDDRSGKLRFSRINGVLTAFRWGQQNWIPIASTPLTSEWLTVGLSVWAPDGGLAGSQVKVAFDT